MATLLVLGSKPQPLLPREGSYDDVACANASGYSAAHHGLPDPVFTVISAILTSGVESGRQSLLAMRGLHTKTLYFLPRTSRPNRSWRKRMRDAPTFIRTTSYWLKHSLRKVSYSWDEFVARGFDEYLEPVRPALSKEHGLLQQMASKRPSTGSMTLIIGMSQDRYSRFILSGFNFELTHAYAQNPEIEQRGTSASRHAPTDIQIFRSLAAHYGNIRTTEPAVHEHCGIPLLESVTPRK